MAIQTEVFEGQFKFSAIGADQLLNVLTDLENVANRVVASFTKIKLPAIKAPAINTANLTKAGQQIKTLSPALTELNRRFDLVRETGEASFVGIGARISGLKQIASGNVLQGLRETIAGTATSTNGLTKALDFFVLRASPLKKLGNDLSREIAELAAQANKASISLATQGDLLKDIAKEDLGLGKEAFDEFNKQITKADSAFKQLIVTSSKGGDITDSLLRSNLEIGNLRQQYKLLIDQGIIPVGSQTDIAFKKVISDAESTASKLQAVGSRYKQVKEEIKEVEKAQKQQAVTGEKQTGIFDRIRSSFANFFNVFKRGRPAATQASQAIDQIASRVSFLERTTNSARKVFLATFGGSFFGTIFGGVATALAPVAGKFFELNDLIQNTGITIRGMLEGSRVDADKAIAGFTAFVEKEVAATPFEFADAIQAAQQLAIQGFDPQVWFRASANAAAAMNKPQEQLIGALIKLQAGATGAAIDQFRDFGLNVSNISGYFDKATGQALTFGQVATATANGTIGQYQKLNFEFDKQGALTTDNAQALQILNAYLTQNATFANAAAARSQSLTGVISNLKDAFSKTLIAFGQPIFEKLTTGAAGFLGVINDLSPKIIAIAGALGEQLGNAISFALDSIFNIQASIETFSTFMTNLVNLVSALVFGDWSVSWDALGQIALNALTNLVDNLAGVVDGAFDWGFSFVDQVAAGIYDAAGSILQDAVGFVGDTIAGFLEPGSPPRYGPLSSIDTWGSGLLNTFIRDFSNADLDFLNKTLEPIGKAMQESFGPVRGLAAFKTVKKDLTALFGELKQTGNINEAIFQKIAAKMPADAKPILTTLRNQLQAQKQIIEADKVIEKARQKVTRADENILAIQQQIIDAERAGFVPAELQHQLELAQREKVLGEDAIKIAEDKKKQVQDQVSAEEQRAGTLEKFHGLEDQLFKQTEEVKRAELGKTTRAANQAAKDRGKAASRGAGATERAAKKEKESYEDTYKKALIALNEKNDQGILTEEEYYKELLRIEENYVDASLESGVTSGLEKHYDDIKRFQKKLEELKPPKSLGKDFNDTYAQTLQSIEGQRAKDLLNQEQYLKALLKAEKAFVDKSLKEGVTTGLDEHVAKIKDIESQLATLTTEAAGAKPLSVEDIFGRFAQEGPAAAKDIAIEVGQKFGVFFGAEVESIATDIPKTFKEKLADLGGIIFDRIKGGFDRLREFVSGLQPAQIFPFSLIVGIFASPVVEGIFNFLDGIVPFIFRVIKALGGLRTIFFNISKVLLRFSVAGFIVYGLILDWDNVVKIATELFNEIATAIGGLVTNIREVILALQETGLLSQIATNVGQALSLIGLIATQIFGLFNLVFKKLLKLVVGEVLAKIAEGVNVFIEDFGGAREFALSLGKALVDLSDTAVKALERIVYATGALFVGDFRRFFDVLAEVPGIISENLGPESLNFLTKFRDTVIGLIPPQVIEALQNFFNQGRLGGELVRLFQTLFELIKTAGPVVGVILGVVLALIVDVIASITLAVVDALPSIEATLAGVVSVITGILSLVTAGYSLIQAVYFALTGDTSKAADLFEATLGQMRDGVLGILRGIVQALLGLVATVVSFAGSVLYNLIGLPLSLIPGFEEAGGAILGFKENGLREISAFVNSAIETLIGWTDDLGPIIETAQIIFLKAIGSMTTGVIDFFAGLYNDPVKTITDLWAEIQRLWDVGSQAVLSSVTTWVADVPAKVAEIIPQITSGIQSFGLGSISGAASGALTLLDLMGLGDLPGQVSSSITTASGSVAEVITGIQTSITTAVSNISLESLLSSFGISDAGKLADEAVGGAFGEVLASFQEVKTTFETDVLPTFASAGTELSGAFTSAKTEITTALSGLKTSLAQTGLSEAFTSASSDIKTAFSDIQTSLQPAIDQIKLALFPPDTGEPGLFDKLKTTFAEIKTTITESLGPAFTALSAKLNELGLNWGTVWTVIRTVITVVITTIITIIFVLIGVFVGLANAVAAMVTNIVATIESWKVAFTTVIGGISQVIAGFGTFFAGIFSGDLSRIVAGANQMFLGMWEIVKGVGLGIMATLQATWGTVIAGVSAFVISVIEFFTDLYNKLVGDSIITDLVNEAIRLFGNMGVRIISAVGRFISGVITKVTKLATNFISAVQGMGNDAITAWGEISFAEMGQKAIDGILKGIEKYKHKVFEVLKGLAKEALKSVGAEWLIKSPSIKFKELGLQAMDGLSLGFSDGFKDFDTLVEEKLKRTLKGFATADLGLNLGKSAKKQIGNFFSFFGPQMVDKFNQLNAAGKLSIDTIKDTVKELTGGLLPKQYSEMIDKFGQQFIDEFKTIQAEAKKALATESLQKALKIDEFRNEVVEKFTSEFEEISSAAEEAGSKLSEAFEEEITPERYEELKAALQSGTQTFTKEQRDALNAAIKTQDKLNAAQEENTKVQQQLLEIEKQRQKLDFLKTQLGLIEMINENQLDATSILGGLQFGIDASVSDVLAALNNATMAMITQAEQNLQVASPSKIFKRFGLFTGQGLEEGILSSVAAVQAAGKKMAAAVLPSTIGLQPNLALSTGGVAANLGRGVEPGAHLAGKTLQLNQTNYINDKVDIATMNRRTIQTVANNL